MSQIANQIGCTSILAKTCAIEFMHLYTSLSIPEGTQLTIAYTSRRRSWTIATCTDRWTSEIDRCITLKVILTANRIGSL